ncbi:Caspase domain-containing protein [Marivirga sericea]|uniref:Caspase domain-containing protein n=1 Tax=Marivirga sericea TaxID=1028 RepID=A0A1X7IKM8_9BACT|nr:caspase family protein [Marivirga sericea]SMG15202.1 Caspase domain-containing protein [Marivirga sericea]
MTYRMLKNIFAITLLSILFIGRVSAQIVGDKTNQIVLDFENESITTSLPSIEWIYPAMEFTNTQENRVNVKAKITSGVPLKSVMLRVLNRKDGTALGTRAADIDDPFNVEIDLSMYVVKGENYLELTAENEEGGIVKDNRSIRVGLDAISDAVMIDRKDYALLFATNRYDNWNDLVNPIFDAEAIGKILEEEYGFIVEIVKDEEQNEVMTKLREYGQRKYKPQDQLFIFFAGHGVYDEVFGEGFVVASNSKVNDVSKNSYISHNRIRSNINNIPCEHIFLSMDVCFGGTFDPLLASSRSALYDDIDDKAYLVKKLSKKTRKYLTSGGKEYVSDGVRGSHSPFAKNFLEALKSYGGSDRILVLDEIKSFMDRSKTTPRFGEFGSDEKGSDFVFVAK